MKNGFWEKPFNKMKRMTTKKIYKGNDVNNVARNILTREQAMIERLKKE